MRFECGVTPPLTKGKAPFNARRIHDDTRSGSSDSDPGSTVRRCNSCTVTRCNRSGSMSAPAPPARLTRNDDTIATSSRPRARAAYTSGTALAAINHGVRPARTFSGPTRLSTALVMTTAPVPSNGSELLCDRASCNSRRSLIGRGSSSDRCTTREQTACATRSKDLPGSRPTDMDERTNDRSTAIRRTSSPSGMGAGCGASMTASSITAVLYPVRRWANLAVPTRQPISSRSPGSAPDPAAATRHARPV